MPASMGPGTTGTPQHITLRPAAGDVRLTLYSGGDAARRQQDVAISGSYTSGENVPTQDVARRVRMFSRGAGFSNRPPGQDASEEWDGYAESENACLRFGYICPSGEQTAVSVTSGWGAPKKLISFNGDLWCIFLNRIAYIDGGTGSLTDYYSNSGDTFTDAEVWNGSLRVAMNCTHSTPNYHSFVTVAPSGGGYAVASNPVDGTYPGMHKLRLLQTVFWEYQGNRAMRLVGQDSDYTFRYMIVPTGDPYDPANWGSAVQVGDTTYQIRRLVSSHDTVWAAKVDGVYAISDANASAGGENLTPYWAEQLAISDAQINCHYYGQYVVASTPMGIDMIDVNSWQVKDRPTPIHISHGRPNNTGLQGRYTAFCTDSGWLVGSVYGNSQANVLYGVPRRRESVASGVTEMDWFSEAGPFTSGQEITCMTVNTASTGRPYLWIGLADGSGTPYLRSVELFLGTSPLADASHRYNTTASVTLTDEHWGARAATKGALRGELAITNCGSGRSVAVYAVAGARAAFPGSPNATISTNVETSTFNLTSVRGSTIRLKLVLTSTATVPVVIDEVGLKANLGFPLRSTGTWLVVVGDERDSDLPSLETPRTVEAALVDLCESVEAVTCFDDEGNTQTVVLANLLPWKKVDRSSNDLASHQKDRVLEVRYQVID